MSLSEILAFKKESTPLPKDVTRIQLFGYARREISGGLVQYFDRGKTKVEIKSSNKFPNFDDESTLLAMIYLLAEDFQAGRVKIDDLSNGKILYHQTIVYNRIAKIQGVQLSEDFIAKTRESIKLMGGISLNFESFKNGKFEKNRTTNFFLWPESTIDKQFISWELDFVKWLDINNGTLIQHNITKFKGLQGSLAKGLLMLMIHKKKELDPRDERFGKIGSGLNFNDVLDYFAITEPEPLKPTASQVARNIYEQEVIKHKQQVKDFKKKLKLQLDKFTKPNKKQKEPLIESWELKKTTDGLELIIIQPIRCVAAVNRDGEAGQYNLDKGTFNSSGKKITK